MSEITLVSENSKQHPEVCAGVPLDKCCGTGSIAHVDKRKGGGGCCVGNMQ